MKTWLKQHYRRSSAVFRLLFPLVRFRDWLAEGGWRPDRAQIARQYRETFGVPLDWTHPQTLNEKLNWMKLHVRDPRQRVAADKYAVRDVVREAIGEEHLIPLIHAYSRPEDIRLSDLPDAFVMKVNHGSGQNRIIRNKSQVDERELRLEFLEWFRTSHYSTSREWPYRGMKPVIVVEELLLNEDGTLPCDYKFHCFGGKVRAIQVDLERETAHRRNFYDLDWNLQPFIWTEWEGDRPSWPNGKAVPRPDGLDEMMCIAEILSKDYPYVRVDLFYCRGRVYFGELTFYHGGAFERFDPPEMDRRFGDLLELPVLSAAAETW